MATVGLKGLWGLEQLDKTGLATWKLGLILMGGGALLGVLLVLVLGDVNPNSVLVSTFKPMLVASMIFLTVTLMGLTLWLTILLSRTTEADLQLLPLTDDVSRAIMKLLRPRKKDMLVQISRNALFSFIFFLAIAASNAGPSISEAITATYASGQILTVFIYLIMPIAGLIFGVFAAFVNAQAYSLRYAARHIEVDLLQLDDYPVIANAAVRVALFGIAIVSIYPLMALYGSSEEAGRVFWPMAILLLLLCILITASYGSPIVILRNRIRDKKKLELDKVHRCLQGDNEVVSPLSIKCGDAPTPDLLTQKMFLESRWEWPIASHVHKLILFGLLPPLTWVVAAMIENAMY
jgi:hypothetical protein